MGKGFRRNFFPAEHSGDLVDTFFITELFNAGCRPPRTNLFAYPEVMTAELGDLRQVGNADDLVDCRYLSQFFSYDRRNLTADACIHLVKHHGLNGFGAGQNDFQRQNDS